MLKVNGINQDQRQDDPLVARDALVNSRTGENKGLTDLVAKFHFYSSNFFHVSVVAGKLKVSGQYLCIVQRWIGFIPE